MRHHFFIFVGITVFLSGCGIQTQRNELQNEQNVVRQKEQELTLKEKELNAKEVILNERQKKLDSFFVPKDTLSKLYSSIPGFWDAKMVCSETTCPGSALGDTRVEAWSIYFQDNRVVAKALNNKKQLTRVYTGGITDSGQIYLTEQPVSVGSENDSEVTITVQLKQRNDNTLIGRREIVQSANCHIIYSLELKKQD